VHHARVEVGQRVEELLVAPVEPGIVFEFDEPHLLGAVLVEVADFEQRGAAIHGVVDQQTHCCEWEIDALGNVLYYLSCDVPLSGRKSQPLVALRTGNDSTLWLSQLLMVDADFHQIFENGRVAVQSPEEVQLVIE
jgi:hypothetical protein